MALAVVTATRIRAASGTSVTVAITAPTPGNLLVVGMNQYRATAANSTVTDNQTNTFTKLAEVDTTGDPGAAMFYAKSILSSGTHNVTLTCATSGTAPSGTAYEASGADTTAPFTGGEVASNTGSSAAPTTGSVTNSVADSIFFAFCGNGGTGNPATMTKDAAWTRHANGAEQDGTLYMVFGMEYLIVASSAARTHAWTTQNTAFGTVAAAFGIAGAAPPATIPVSARAVLQAVNRAAVR